MSRQHTKKTTISRHGRVHSLFLLPETHADSLKDMLGFKLEAPRREGSVESKTRPIYLDMQVRSRLLL